jgi:hypothetical protein
MSLRRGGVAQRGTTTAVSPATANTRYLKVKEIEI